MEISLIFNILGVIIVICVLYFLFLRKKKDIIVKESQDNNKNVRPIQVNMAGSGKNDSVFSTQMSNKEHTSEALPNESGASGNHATIRKFMQSGIDAIFTPEKNYLKAEKKPLTIKDISPETMKLILDHISSLKNFRSEHIKLQKIINDPSVQMADLSKIVQSDPVLAAKILRMANSSYFGIQNKIDSIGHALMILGLQNVKNILYRESMLELFQAGSPNQKEKMIYLWKHASIASVCASYFYDLFDDLNKGALFTLGILHDIGKLIILGLPQVNEKESEFREKYPYGTSIQEEDSILGINHAVIGQIILEQWGFSELMISSVSRHHMPSFTDMNSLGLYDEQRRYTTVLFLADQVAKLFAGRMNGAADVNSLPDSYLQFIDKNKFTNKVMDGNFQAQMLAAEAIVDSEYQVAAPNEQKSSESLKQKNFEDTKFDGESTVSIKIQGNK